MYIFLLFVWGQAKLGENGGKAYNTDKWNASKDTWNTIQRNILEDRETHIVIY